MRGARYYSGGRRRSSAVVNGALKEDPAACARHAERWHVDTLNVHHDARLLFGREVEAFAGRLHEACRSALALCGICNRHRAACILTFIKSIYSKPTKQEVVIGRQVKSSIQKQQQDKRNSQFALTRKAPYISRLRHDSVQVYATATSPGATTSRNTPTV